MVFKKWTIREYKRRGETYKEDAKRRLRYVLS